MHIDLKTIEKIGKLSRLSFDADKAKSLETDLSQILSWVEQLQEVDTDKVHPLKSVNLDEMPQRQDDITDGSKAPAILSNAPATSHNMFEVPKVVE